MSILKIQVGFFFYIGAKCFPMLEIYSVGTAWVTATNALLNVD